MLQPCSLKTSIHRRGTRPTGGSGLSYLRKRALELATPATRATGDPLAKWALNRIRLDGRPFRFEGHEYLRAIYDDTSPHIVLSKAAQIGGTSWAILRSLHACLNGLNVVYFFPTRTDVLGSYIIICTPAGPRLRFFCTLSNLTHADSSGPIVMAINPPGTAQALASNPALSSRRDH